MNVTRRLWIIQFLVVIFTCEAMGLTCYCENYCPQMDMFNGTCEVTANSYCFSAVELVFDPELNINKKLRTFGCLSPDESGLMQCRGYLTKHARPKNISCCREFDLCNQELFPQLSFEEEVSEMSEYSVNMTQLLTIFCVFMAFIVIAMILGYYLCRKRIKKHIECYKNSRRACGDFLSPSESKGSSDMYDQSSGSGSGLSRLVQLTIGKQIEQIRIIGKGRYGEVLLGKWRGESVAVKVFCTTDEASWLREKEIYQTILLRHENILGFIAADIRGTASHTQMLLITDYHDLGSLNDYLKINALDKPTLVKMASSIISGIWHLHSDINATTGKPAIAHRDIKSKNILVKRRDGECCVADFGLAVKYSSRHGVDVGSNPKVGTRRYMAPEVLDDSIDIQSFKSLISADIYSYTLVLWEICKRCGISSSGNYIEAEDYQLPYSDHVGADPSFDEMYKVVCLQEKRPTIPPHWYTDPLLNEMCRILSECWHTNPSIRWPALTIKKRIKEVASTKADKLLQNIV